MLFLLVIAMRKASYSPEAGHHGNSNGLMGRLFFFNTLLVGRVGKSLGGGGGLGVGGGQPEGTSPTENSPVKEYGRVS